MQKWIDFKDTRNLMYDRAMYADVWEHLLVKCFKYKLICNSHDLQDKMR